MKGFSKRQKAGYSKKYAGICCTFSNRPIRGF